MTQGHPAARPALVAAGDAIDWNTILSRQWIRVLDAPTTADRDYDLVLYAIALRGVLRAADLAFEVAKEHGLVEGEARVRAAIDAFKATVPQTIDVRDVLEHFDAYRMGVGKLQRTGRMGGFVQWVEDADPAGPVLVLGGTLRLPTALANAAASYLTDEVVQAMRVFGDE